MERCLDGRLVWLLLDPMLVQTTVHYWAPSMVLASEQLWDYWWAQPMGFPWAEVLVALSVFEKVSDLAAVWVLRSAP